MSPAYRPWFSLTVLMSVALSFPLAAADSGKPNILLIVADDLGYGELTIQGFTSDIPTPNIDSIANGGVRFTSGYVSGPYCSPTRAALLTGRYQQRFGHEFKPGPAATAGAKVGLDVTQKTAGDRLKAAGYVTAWIGKSHLGYEQEFHPNKRGFDYYFGFLGGAHGYLNAGGNGRDPVQRNGQPVPKMDYLTEELGREAADFIEKNRSQPWFTYLAFNAVHAPLESTDKYLARFTGINDSKRRSFAAMLSALDDAVGMVLTRLRETGQTENTLIFFISDNGGPTPSITSGNGPLRGYKAQTWEGGVRVPWFVQWKGRIPAGKVDDRPVIQLDILPTALAAAGVTPQPDWKLEGVNLLPYLAGEKSGPPHAALFWRFGQQMAVRKGDWKLVKGTGAGVPGGAGGDAATAEGAQLFNLAQDIGEKNNLAEKEPEKVRELAATWNEWDRENVPAKWTPGQRAGGNQPFAASDAAHPKAPWKSGDAVSGDATPRVAGRGFQIDVRIDSAAPKGVILAQGGKARGYALFVNGDKLALAVRAERTLNVVTADKSLEPGKHDVSVQLSPEGKVTLNVDGEKVGEGKAPLIAKQPGEGLNVGSDGKSPVGEYDAPNEFSGKIGNATVTIR